MVVDDVASKPADGIIISQPFTFIKGVVVSQAEFVGMPEVPVSRARGWTRGREFTPSRWKFSRLTEAMQTFLSMPRLKDARMERLVLSGQRYAALVLSKKNFLQLS